MGRVTAEGKQFWALLLHYLFGEFLYCFLIFDP